MSSYEERNEQRLALINEMLSDAEIINPELAVELRADISDINDSEYGQYWAIDQLIEFNKNNTRIDEFLERAKALGWADQYAKNGKWFKEAVEAAAKDDADYFFAEGVKFADGGGVEDNKMSLIVLPKDKTYFDTVLKRASIKTFKIEKHTFDYVYHFYNAKDRERAFGYLHTLFADGGGVEIEVSDVAKRYVDYYMEEDIAFIFDKLGMDMPTELEGEYFETEMDDARTFAEGYFTENPDEMTDKYGNPFAFNNGGGVGEYVVDGTKKFYEQHGIGKAKYTISFHDGVSTNKDGSAFYGIEIFHNKPDLEKFKQKLLSKGYVYKYADGGGIPNNYIGKTKEQVWNSWTKDQRIHFIQDHDKNVLMNAEEEAELDYDDIHDTVISDWIGEHMFSGQYHGGGGVGSFRENEKVSVRVKPNEWAEGRIVRFDNGSGSYVVALSGKYESQFFDANDIKKYGKAADGTEIDAMVTDWKNVKKALGGGGGGMFDPKMLKAYDIETKSIHNIIKIDYDDDLIVMSSEKYGRTKNDLSKVKLFFEAGTEIQAPTITATATPTPVVTPTPAIPTPTPTPAVTTTKDANVTKQIPLAPKSQQVIKVDPTVKRSRFSKILQEMWAEAKGTGLTLISAEYMQKIEDALFTDATSSTYEDMILEVMTWLIDNDIILRSKPFMKKIRTSFEDTQQSS